MPNPYQRYISTFIFDENWLQRLMVPIFKRRPSKLQYILAAHLKNKEDEMVTTKSETKQDNADVICAVVNVNEGAYNAQKQVNLQLMRKIGQLVIAQKSEEF